MKRSKQSKFEQFFNSRISRYIFQHYSRSESCGTVIQILLIRWIHYILLVGDVRVSDEALNILTW